MEDPVLIGLMLAVPASLTAIASLIMAWRTSGQIYDVHVAVNSRLDELVKATQAAAFAEGFQAGRETATN